MHRMNPSDNLDTGWFLGCTNREHDHDSPPNLRRISLYEAMVKREPSIVPFFGLPTDTKITFDGRIPTFERRGEKLVVLPDSYLHKKYPVEV